MARKRQKPQLDNHMRKLLYMQRIGALPALGGSAQLVDVYHDDWCALYSGKGPRCNCDPDIRLKGPVDAARPH
jgi:hypothetical protein